MILGQVRKLVLEAYGVIPNPCLTPSHNASIQINNMPLWYYHNRATNMALHDITLPTTNIPKNLDFLLGLGLKFCPIPRYTTRDPTKSLDRFPKDLFVKNCFTSRPMNRDKIYIPSFKVDSDWEPKPWDLPNDIIERFESFSNLITNFLKRDDDSTTIYSRIKRWLSQLLRYAKIS